MAMIQGELCHLDLAASTLYAKRIFLMRRKYLVSPGCLRRASGLGEIEQLVVRMAKENSDWGYDRIVGAMANLGYNLSDQTVGKILQRNGIPSASERQRTTTWTDFIRAHMSVLAGTDFFSVEVLTLRGLVTYYVLFFIHLESRRVEIAGITRHPNEAWMKQIARNGTMDEWGFRARFPHLRLVPSQLVPLVCCQENLFLGTAKSFGTGFRPEVISSNGNPCQAMFAVCGKGEAGVDIILLQFGEVFQ
jgi:hypothetical protein